MGPCRVCHATEVRASHRQGWLERGPLTWCGILPYRCGHCHTRFFRVAWRDPRRRHPYLEDAAADESRAPRWAFRASATVTPQSGDGPRDPLTGETENLSVRGVRIRLSAPLPVGTPVELTMHGLRARLGTVCWVRPSAPKEFVHGVEFRAPLERGTLPSGSLRQLRRQRARRRALVALAALALVAAITAGLVWLMDALRLYDLRHYEPKDLERYEIQRRDAARPGSDRR